MASVVAVVLIVGCPLAWWWRQQGRGTVHAGAAVDVYPVGWLAARKNRRMWSEFRYLRERVMDGNWRAIHNTFNGYLAEPVGDWPVIWYRCGHGWTKRRAVNDLFRHMADVATGGAK